MRRELGAVNHQRVERIYTQEGLQLPRRRKGRRRDAGRAVPLAALSGPNQRWSMDFVQDSTVGGRRIRALSIVDQFTRECPAIEVDTSITGQREVRVLDRLSGTHGRPQALVLDNRPTVNQQAASAFLGDIGITSSLFSAENCCRVPKAPTIHPDMENRKTKLSPVPPLSKAGPSTLGSHPFQSGERLRCGTDEYGRQDDTPHQNQHALKHIGPGDGHKPAD